MRFAPFLAIVFAARALAGDAGTPSTPPPAVRCITRPARFELSDPDPHVLHVTHAWPHCGPCVKLSPRPAFLLRFDGVVDPVAVLASIEITGGTVQGWRKLAWTLKACVTETSGTGRTATTLLFQPAEPLEPSLYDWFVPNEVGHALHWGLSTVNLHAGGVFVVGAPVGERHPTASITAQLGVGREPAEVFGHLRNARESMAMLREWSDLEVPRANLVELSALEAEFRALRGDAGQPLPFFSPLPK